jgi:hypothetical protein
MALNSLFINAAMILWTADIAPGKDADGQPILVAKDEYIYNGLIM